MAETDNLDCVCKLPDLQNQTDERGIDLDRVGITNIYFPINVTKKEILRDSQEVSARVKLFVHLPMQYKGANLSRFMQCLVKYEGRVIDNESMAGLLDDLKEKMKSKDAYARFEFDFYKDVRSPVSDNYASQRYRCAFIGQHENGTYNFITEVNVVAASVCPCSREMSLLENLDTGSFSGFALGQEEEGFEDYLEEDGKKHYLVAKQVGMGAHNQRSNIRIRLMTKKGEMIWLEDLIDLVEEQASAKVYPILKRPDEKWVTEHGYNNAKFSEDIARDVYLALKNHPSVYSWAIRVYNEESIHSFDVSSYVKSSNWAF